MRAEGDNTDMRVVMGRGGLLNVSLGNGRHRHQQQVTHGIANCDQRLSLRKLRVVVVCHLY